MKKLKFPTKIVTLLLLFSLSLFQAADTVQAASTRSSDSKKAGSGNIFAGVSGTFERVEKSKILKESMKSARKPAKKATPIPAAEENSPLLIISP